MLLRTCEISSSSSMSEKALLQSEMTQM